MADNALIITEAMDLGIAADVIASTLDGAILVFIKTDLALDRNTLLADVVAAQADFTGFATPAVTWLDPSRADDGAIEVVGTVPEVRPTGTTIGNDIFGVALCAPLLASLWGVCSFEDGPFPMRSILDAILATVRWRPELGSLIVTVS